MPRFLFPAFLLGALLSASTITQAQSDTRTNTTAVDPWAATDAVADAPQYATGWSSAPGMSLSLHQRPTTDYRGRPLKQQAKVKRVSVDDLAIVDANDDPMMHSSGVMIAPGMNTAPYRGVSTDYNGRPLRKSTHTSSTIGAKMAKAAPVAVVPSTTW
ncbi:hypothetical protein [Hymenobacter sp. GOD-10R]|uniref:hypothetical protein n=1 Tax=Hymenobacter sp. GOD-10R TaxID=3093922 RepID=UPI002D777D94|nr:hypothetical protein [Hymenobacter sp. GOD-10R]WRQ28943.1 hypothetical protein SD425_01530 [Hymenobacter sp. GOD-10R]